MTFIVWFLWNLIWGLAGYFTVRAIILYVEKRRMEKAWADYMQHQRLMKSARIFDTAGVGLFDYFIDDLLKKDLA